MKLIEALAIVVDLATDNVIEEFYCKNDEVLTEERENQLDALDTVSRNMNNLLSNELYQMSVTE